MGFEKHYVIIIDEISIPFIIYQQFDFIICHLNIDASNLQLLFYEKRRSGSETIEKIYLLENMIKYNDKFQKQVDKIKKMKWWLNQRLWYN